MSAVDEAKKKEQTHVREGEWWRHVVAGGVSGPVSRTCTAPLDRVRLVVQVSPRRQGTRRALAALVRDGGVRGLWRGNGINVLKVGPEMACKFGVFERLRAEPEAGLARRFAAGAAAGVLSQLATYPLDVLKTRLSLRRSGQTKGILHAAHVVHAQYGWRGFYLGYKPSCLGVVPYTGVDLAVYDTLRRYFLAERTDGAAWPTAACGAASTALGQVCSYPFYLVKTRVQAGAQLPETRASVLRALQSIVQREGLRGLYRGLAPSMCKVLPASAINYTVYDQVSRYLAQHY